MAIISGGSRKSIKTISLFGVSYIMKGSWHCWCLPQISSKYSKGPPQNFIRKPIIFDRYANYWFLTDTDERWGKGVVYCFILSWLFKTNLLRFFGRPPIFQVLERNYCNRYWLFFRLNPTHVFIGWTVSSLALQKKVQETKVFISN